MIKLKLKTLRFQRGKTPLCYGFTIIELIVVIAIITILLSIATIIASKIIRKERVENETARIVSLLKEAQKYSMIDTYYKDKDKDIIQKRHYGVKFFKSQDVYNVAMVRKSLKEENQNSDIVKTYDLKGIKLSKVPNRNNNEQVKDLTEEYVYFNDIGATSDNKTIRVSDTGDEYKRNIVISQMGNINIEKP